MNLLFTATTLGWLAENSNVENRVRFLQECCAAGMDVPATIKRIDEGIACLEQHKANVKSRVAQMVAGASISGMQGLRVDVLYAKWGDRSLAPAESGIIGLPDAAVGNFYWVVFKNILSTFEVKEKMYSPDERRDTPEYWTMEQAQRSADLLNKATAKPDDGKEPSK